MTTQHPGRRLAVIVALLAMLAPFSIDTYLPSFPDIALEFNTSALYLQQTLSFYLWATKTVLAFRKMN